MELKNYTTPKPGYLLRVWGGFFNDGLGAKLLGTDSSNFWFDTVEEGLAAKAYLKDLASKQATSNARSVCSMDSLCELEGDITKRTVAKMVLEWPSGKRYPYSYDFGYGYDHGAAFYSFEEGNYACDCNLSALLQQRYPDEDLPKLPCGDTILIHDLTIVEEA